MSDPYRTSSDLASAIRTTAVLPGILARELLRLSNNAMTGDFDESARVAHLDETAPS
jgi:hypothetical protein